ncbi:MAG TPA: uroporphyrinogen decarboxylase family protein [Spirochaetia bacterium]|nr:uroporphyrinogen decarboxylase family protein [Spirochaetia bacterium]
MNARERMLAAIHHERCDRVPTDIWATPESWAKLERAFGSGFDRVMDALHIDGMETIAPEYAGPPIAAVGPDEQVDFWGMRSRRVGHATGAYWEQSFFPLAFAQSIEDLDRYRWPSADWFDYSGLREKAAAAREKRVVQSGYMAPFYYHNLLRGLERSLMDPLDDAELTREILKRICDFFFEYHLRVFEACGGMVDVAQVTDDYGSQTGPLIGLPTFRDFYKPHLQRFIDLCHAFGVTVFHHDDGAIRPFLPELVTMGIDILNPVQHACPGMEMEGLKRDFGHRLCFHGGIDNQKTLPFGTPKEVREEVRHAIDALSPDGTGYILAPCHNIQAVSPLENVVAMYDEAFRYGCY